MREITLDMYQTLGLAIILLLLGNWIKSKVEVLRSILSLPVVGGLLFSILMLIGHTTQIVTFNFDSNLRNFFMVVFLHL